MGRLVYWIAVNAHCSLLYKTKDPGCEPLSLPFAFLLSIENMGLNFVSLHVHALSPFTLILLSNGGLLFLFYAAATVP